MDRLTVRVLRFAVMAKIKLPPVPPNALSVSFPWYRDRDHYDRCKGACSDAALMPSYEHWLQRTEQAVKQLRDDGVVVHCIELDLDLFLAWCRAHKFKPDRHARAGFAAASAPEIDEGRDRNTIN